MKTDWSQLPREIWDAGIIGAGPAGSVAASLLAERGWRVLLVEKSTWPREKVCGGCLSAAAVELLHQTGLGGAVRNAQRLYGVSWQVSGQSVHIPAPGGAALLRSDLDAALVDSAIKRACEFVSGVSARLLPDDCSDYRTIELRGIMGVASIRARVVLACDGIGGRFLADEGWAKWRIARGAWMGVSATFDDWPNELPPGDIHMHIGKGGYVGLVCMGNRQVHLAAALDPNVCRNGGGPVGIVRSILHCCGQPVGISSEHFHGTGLLTRRRDKLGGNRVLAIGDACGYVEPFTGEGIAWAIASVRDAAGKLSESPNRWPADLPERWTAQQRMKIARRQRLCRAMMPMVHHPTMAAGAVFLARAAPALGRFAAHRTGHPVLPNIRSAYEGLR